jgi:hypothetical protein
MAAGPGARASRELPSQLFKYTRITDFFCYRDPVGSRFQARSPVPVLWARCWRGSRPELNRRAEITMNPSPRPGRRAFLGVASTAALAAAASGCSRAARATAAASAASPATTIGTADRLLRAGYFAKADALYAQILARDPGNLAALAQHGYVALLNNKLSQARAILQRVVSAQPGNQQAAQNLAAALYRLNDFPAAAAAYRRLGPAAAPMAAMLASFGDAAPYQLAGPDATRLPFLRTSPLPMVSISVNGSAAVPVHLDTGGGALAVDASYAASAGVRQVAPGWGRADRITLGGIEARNVPVTLGQGPASNLRAPDGQPDHGILGTGLLSQFLFTMDYAHAALELRRPTPAPLSQLQAQSRRAVTVPFWMTGDHFMVTWATINGRPPVLLVIDTGGENLGLGITQAEAMAAGVRLDKSKERRAPAGIINGKAVTATYIPFTVNRLALGAAASCGIPGAASITTPPPAAGAFGFATSGRVSHSYFLPFAATFDLLSMRLFLSGSASSCGTWA